MILIFTVFFKYSLGIENFAKKYHNTLKVEPIFKLKCIRNQLNHGDCVEINMLCGMISPIYMRLTDFDCLEVTCIRQHYPTQHTVPKILHNILYNVYYTTYYTMYTMHIYCGTYCTIIYTTQHTAHHAVQHTTQHAAQHILHNSYYTTYIALCTLHNMFYPPYHVQQYCK